MSGKPVEVANEWRKHVAAYYGVSLGETSRIAREVTPVHIRSLKESMRRDRWPRASIESAIATVRRMMKWAGENALVPAGTLSARPNVADFLSKKGGGRGQTPPK
jgi:hypothetical protein